MSAVTKQEIVEHLRAVDSWFQADALADRIEQHGIALSRKYVPMTDDELEILLKKSEVYNQFSGWEWEREIEAEVISRFLRKGGAK